MARPRNRRLLHASLLVLIVFTAMQLSGAQIETPSPTPTDTPTPPTPTSSSPETPTPTPTPSCGPRVRRPWGSLSSGEKQLYLDAVNLSMAKGYHALFLEVHTEPASISQGRKTCTMAYWHRRMLIAYENMLRSLGSQYACITIPYWDYFSDYAKRQALTCSTFEGCSQFMQEFGSSSGPTETVTMNGYWATGNCVSTTPLANFCESSSIPASSCSRCIPRDPSWTSKPFPSGFSYLSLARQLSVPLGFANWHAVLFGNYRFTMNYWLTSTMATSAAAADPMYYVHQSTIDLLMQMWTECQVGRTMTAAEKQTSPYAFASCIYYSGETCASSTSDVSHYWQQAGSTTRIRAEDHPVLQQFFAPLPTQYWQYVSATDLGDFSYSYDKDALFSMLMANTLACPQNMIRRLQEKQDSIIDQMTIDSFKGSSDPRTQAVVKSVERGQLLLDKLMENQSADSAIELAEMVECLYHKLELGAVEDFTPAHRQDMEIPDNVHPRCYTLLQQYARTIEKLDKDAIVAFFRTAPESSIMDDLLTSIIEQTLSPSKTPKPSLAPVPSSTLTLQPTKTSTGSGSSTSIRTPTSTTSAPPTLTATPSVDSGSPKLNPSPTLSATSGPPESFQPHTKSLSTRLARRKSAEAPASSLRSA